MNIDDEMTVGTLLAALDEHLRRVRGVCPGTRRNYAKYVGEFLVTVFADGASDPRLIRPSDVIAFVGGAPARYRSRTVESAATSLRSFFRFLRSEGLREDRLDDAVPMVPRR
ncbi:site-specific integrase [Arthrobacter sp. UYCu723]